MRYFSTQRPLGPGCFPKVQGNEVMEIENYDRKMFREEIGREAWGSIVYRHPLAEIDASIYELTPEKFVTKCNKM